MEKLSNVDSSVNIVYVVTSDEINAISNAFCIYRSLIFAFYYFLL